MEGPHCLILSVVDDGGRYRMLYATRPPPKAWSREWYGAYLESEDGITWRRPSYGLVEVGGSTANNLFMAPTERHPGYPTSVIRDTNPAARPAERYKAIVCDKGNSRGIYGMVSDDGFHWRDASDGFAIRAPEPDTQVDADNTIFWDGGGGSTPRTCAGGSEPPPEALPPDFEYAHPGYKRSRTIRRAASPDFREWTELEYLDPQLSLRPREQFYTNAAIPYERARNLYLMFPHRHVEERKFMPDWPQDGLADVGFVTSRDGIRLDRTFREAWLRPGREQGNWHERSMKVAQGLIQTGPDELSLYFLDGLKNPSHRYLRATVRLDGFASVNAPFAGGESTTPPVTFTGTALELNYATSALGALRVELQDEHGCPLPGFALEDSAEIFGDEIDRVVTWRGESSTAPLVGRPIRLRCWLSDADLYAFRFRDSD